MIYRHNTWLPEGNKAYSVEGSNSKDVKDNVMKGILATLKANKRTVLFTSNNKYGTRVAKTVAEAFPDKIVLLYNKYTDGKVKDAHFDNIDRVWIHADLVIYSPTLTAGPSFNIIGHFDCIFMKKKTASFCNLRCSPYGLGLRPVVNIL